MRLEVFATRAGCRESPARRRAGPCVCIENSVAVCYFRRSGADTGCLHAWQAQSGLSRACAQKVSPARTRTLTATCPNGTLAPGSLGTRSPTQSVSSSFFSCPPSQMHARRHSLVVVGYRVAYAWDGSGRAFWGSVSLTKRCRLLCSLGLRFSFLCATCACICDSIPCRVKDEGCDLCSSSCVSVWYSAGSTVNWFVKSFQTRPSTGHELLRVRHM